MRTIKFRAWHKEEKLMIPEVLAWVNNPSAQYIKFAKLKDYQGNPLNNPTFANLDQVELMQFTGLLDKNGKEIFEGDIVTTGEVINYQIIFKEGCFGFENINRFNGLSMNYAYMTNDLASIVAVIGNIYENKNLLNYEK